MKKISKFIVLVSILCMFFTLSVNAETTIKTANIDLNKDYVRCTFYVSFDNGINRKTTLTSPNMKHYDFVYDEESNGLKCEVQDVKKGTWKIASSVEPFNADEEIPEELINDIGKITVNVKSEEELKDSVEDSIKIAKEIAGLRYYFKDDSIVVEWQDKNIGDVNITVTDSNTLQTLGKETVNSGYYELPLKNTVKEIILNIVPSQSQGINGSECQFVLPFVNNPKASIIFDDIDYTNVETLHGIASFENEYTLAYEVNGVMLDKTDTFISGDNDFNVPLENGENDIKVYVVDEKGNMRSTSTSIILDTVPPTLKITEDINGLSTYDNNITFCGQVTDYDFLIFRNQEVEPDWEGNFSCVADLNEGSNDIQLIASDRAGNEAIYNATVTMLVEEPVQVPWNIIITVLIIIIIVAIVLIRKKKGYKISIPSLNGENKTTVKGNIEKLDLIWSISLILFVILLTQFIFRIGVVSSGSMEPTIMTGDITIDNRLAYTFKEPQRGDIITLRLPEYKNAYFTKRVIGLPGDKIEFVDGYVLINGVVCHEEYLNENVETNSNLTFEVPSDCYFVLGDNRENSLDSRYWKEPYVSKKQIKGQMILHTDIIATLKK